MAAPQSSSDRLKVFISYSRKELAVADAIADALEARGMDVLIDRRDLPYGEHWQAELAELIRNSDAVVWLVSQSSVLSRWCNWELGEVIRLGKRLVPIAVEPLSSKDLPEAIGKVHLLPHEGAFSMESHLATLQHVLETNSAWIKENTRLADRARQWIAKSRNSALLLRGATLRDAQAWLDARRPTAPMPSAETLELLLASRRANARRRLWLAASPVLATLAFAIPYAIALFALTKVLPDTNIAMGDIVNSEGDTGFEGTYLGCRLRCVFNRFDKPCVAFSYNKSVVPKDQEAHERRCFPKYAADFYWSPSKIGTEHSDTEIMPTFFGTPPSPKPSPYLMRWYRTLSGDPVDPADVLGKVDNFTFISDDKSGQVQWSLPVGECQQTCIDLGDKCKGFSYTSIANRCELFKSVRGVLRDQATGRPVLMPATISGCDDPNATVDPQTKASECPPRNVWMQKAPARSRTPEATPAPAKAGEKK